MKVIDLLSSPWAILPHRLEQIHAIYASHLRAEKAEIADIEARLGRPLANEQKGYELFPNGVAVLSVEGVIAPKANLFTQISGGTSAQLLLHQLESAAADSKVKAILQLIDSPGGSVFGTPEYAARVYEISKVKPIVSLSDGVMASAAYWLGAAANQVYVTGPTVNVGSIGVVVTHNYNPRSSGEQTEISAGTYKRIATPNSPLSKEGRAYLQGQADHIYSVFVEAISKYRGTSVDDVLRRMADGRTFIGQQAIDAGLVDGFYAQSALVAELGANPERFATRKRNGRTAAANASSLLAPLPIGTADPAAVVAAGYARWGAAWSPRVRTEFEWDRIAVARMKEDQCDRDTALHREGYVTPEISIRREVQAPRAVATMDSASRGLPAVDTATLFLGEWGTAAAALATAISQPGYPGVMVQTEVQWAAAVALRMHCDRCDQAEALRREGFIHPEISVRR